MKDEKIPTSDPIQNDREPRTEFVYFLPCAKRIYDLIDKQTKRGLIEDAIKRGFDGMTFMNDVGSGHTRTYTIEELLESLDDAMKDMIYARTNIKIRHYDESKDDRPYKLPEGVVQEPDPRISFEPFHLDEKEEKRMAKEKRERHFLKRYLERRKKELMGMMNEKIEQLFALGSTYESIKEYTDVIARIDEVRRVIEVCEERGRF